MSHKRFIDMTDCANILKNYVYLCVEADNTYKNQFRCQRFGSYEEADAVFKLKFSGPKYYDDNSTLIQIPKFIPLYFHPHLLKTDISKMLIGVTIVDKVED